MDIALAFVLFFGGVVVAECYNHIRRKGEFLARQNGYKQALQEYENYKAIMGNCLKTLCELYKEAKGDEAKLPEEFFEKVAKDGKASIRLK